jgi:hypothetical protein
MDVLPLQSQVDIGEEFRAIKHAYNPDGQVR